jgi:hypothetical protein
MKSRQPPRHGDTEKDFLKNLGVSVVRFFVMSSFPYKRAVVVGVTSSGKSTLAEKLAQRFGLNYIELDALNWEPKWRTAPLDVFRKRVEKATHAEQ